MMLHEENWKLFPEDDEILVSESGRILSYKDRWNNNKWKEITTSIQNSGYLYCSFGLVHRIVAKTWVVNPNPDLFLEVNHIDGNKLNNHFSNLEWTTRSKNVKHAYDSGLRTGPNMVSVVVLETGQIFNSQLEAAKTLGLNQGDISNVLNGVVKHVSGYTFMRVPREKD